MWPFLAPLMVLSVPAGAPAAQACFGDADRARLVNYWSAPERYDVSLPPANAAAPWQVRLTPEASLWLYRYQRAMGAAKAPPTADPTAATGSGSAAWAAWVRSKIDFDRSLARRAADRLNTGQAVSGAPERPPDRGTLASRGAGRDSVRAQEPAAPARPGPIPADLLAAAGDPPPLAEVVTPMQHTVTFDDGDSYVYQDHTNVPAGYAYYRFAQGVGTGGAPLTDADRAALFQAAGLTDVQRRVMTAVSRLEGSFDAVNTYDTGFVSVGFIQFITSDDGRHSLADVLAHEKQADGPAFERDFRQFGVDITADGAVAVVDPSTGAELAGPDAVRKIVDDKRLIAVFQRAGRRSQAFRVAQVLVAREGYWPEDDPIQVTLDGRMLSGKVSDVIKSEAGLATMFDRKVNRGSVAPLADVVARVMKAHGLTSLSDASQYEREIVAGCRYRVDFLADSSLGQPNEAGK